MPLFYMAVSLKTTNTTSMDLDGPDEDPSSTSSSATQMLNQDPPVAN